MKSQQPNLAQVWQRIRGTPPSDRERQTTLTLISLLQADAACLRSFPSAQLLRQQLEEQAAALRGIMRLSTGRPTGKGLSAPATANLTECYHHCTDRLREYLLRSSDPVFAPVYTCLAEQARQHCLMLARLAGEAP